MVHLINSNPSFYYIWVVIIFLFGLCIGSFINVCICRMPKKESVVTTPSHCPTCGENIRWYDNIPLLSWMILRGKCRGCSTSISIRYFYVELLAGLLFVICFVTVVKNYYPITILIPYFLATFMFISVFFIDLKHRIIPNKITYPVIVISLISATLFPESVGRFTFIGGFLDSLCGGIVAGGIFFVVSYIGEHAAKRPVLGVGDIKFIAAVGTCFGLFPAVWFFTILFGSLFGIIVGIMLIIINRGSLKTAVPFGPMLAVGGYVWIILGPFIIIWYMNVIGKLFFY